MQELAKIKAVQTKGMKCKIIDSTYPVNDGPGALAANIDRICDEASAVLPSLPAPLPSLLLSRQPLRMVTMPSVSAAAL